MPDQLARGADAVGDGRQFLVRLERIARCDEQPHGVEVESLQALQRDELVPLVRRVEAAAEEPDAEAGS